ncbi:hypothetical protein SAMN04487950_1945 [Halogranum rubrum]|uniref:PRC-barrel domain-containing protein n=2 Tax=Halogranum rubrum TaxID=553466 RepID=A0A1I4E8X0_9EURY|nr:MULTISPECIES: hypothetical protein [Halogranum]EJN60703.1 hypothetical protein HSB1_13060 [Halogranum salarium B-1]SFL01370.1 hypothetical protein SAMN04487950_1945 [Halogranum rubrum]
MEHITDELVGKHVEGPNGEAIGKVTAVEADKAILKGESGLSASTESALTDDNDRLALEPEQIETVSDDTIYLHADV